MQDGRVRIRIPTTIRTSGFHLHACHVETTLQCLDDIVFHVFTTASGKNLDHCLTVCYINDGEITAGLHYVRVGGYHAYYSVMAGVDGIDEVVLNFNGHLLCRCCYFLGKELNICLNTFVLAVEVFEPLVYKFLQGFDVLFGECQHNLCFIRNDITHLTTMPRGKTCVQLFHCLTDETHHEFVGIGTSLVNLQSAVSAAQSFQCDTDSCIFRVCVYFLIAHGGSDVDTASRADDELAPMLGVKIHEDITL